MNNDWLESYLNLLGIKGREPTLETLTELAKAHEPRRLRQCAVA